MNIFFFLAIQRSINGTSFLSERPARSATEYEFGFCLCRICLRSARCGLFRTVCSSSAALGQKCHKLSA